MAAVQHPSNKLTVSFVGGFSLLVGLTYFGTFFLTPLVGNRFYYRYLCPYGAERAEWLSCHSVAPRLSI
jgi:glutamate synthase (NADPH/NADH) small chain